MAQPSHELGALIARAQERNDWTDRDLQNRAEQLGITSLSRSNFSRWRTKPVVSIKGSTLRDLARVLSVSEETVTRAALQSMGLDLGYAAPVSSWTAVAQDPYLSARDKALLGALLGAMMAERPGTTNPAEIRVYGEPEED